MLPVLPACNRRRSGPRAVDRHADCCAICLIFQASAVEAVRRDGWHVLCNSPVNGPMPTPLVRPRTRTEEKMTARAASLRLSGAWESGADFALRRPGVLLASVLAMHVLAWTVVPLLVCGNLQLDLLEALALGKEWQLGYWKHPPLPWWLADAAYRLSGDVRSVYLLGPASTAPAMYF